MDDINFSELLKKLDYVSIGVEYGDKNGIPFGFLRFPSFHYTPEEIPLSLSRTSMSDEGKVTYTSKKSSDDATIYVERDGETPDTIGMIFASIHTNDRKQISIDTIKEMYSSIDSLSEDVESTLAEYGLSPLDGC